MAAAAGALSSVAEDTLFVQRGIISRGQALDCGVTEGQLRAKVESREWVALEAGVYRVNPPDRLYTERVLTQVLRADGVASHRTAARLLGIDRFPRFGGVEVITSAHLESTDEVTFHQIRKPEFEVEHVERGIPVTSVPWTIAMLGAVAPLNEVEWAVDWAVRTKWETWKSLDEFVRMHARRGRPGFRKLREVLQLRGPAMIPTDSILETLYLQLLRTARLPTPVQQFPIGRKLLADFAFPEHKLIVETLGRGPHDPNGAAFDNDRARTNLIRRLMPGWTVLEFTWNHVTRKKAWVIATTKHFLR